MNMKVTAKNCTTPESFEPIALEFIIASEKQLDAIYAVFCHIGICEFLRDKSINPDDIRTALECVNKKKPCFSISLDQLVSKIR